MTRPLDDFSVDFGRLSRGADPESPSRPHSSLVARLVEEMDGAWERGECPRAEEFLARHPELATRPADAVSLIYEEFCLRQDCGQGVPSQEVLSRFPQWRTELEVLLDCHRLLGTPANAPAFPEVGDSLGGFRLLAVLGSGALGRVFLASQSPLADRPVVLKVTPRDGQEHLSLARLQHTHIVPLYAVEDYLTEDLRVLCMPYLGGAALSQVLEVLHAQPPEQRMGLDLLRALDQSQAPVPVAPPAAGPARQFLSRVSYAQAVCWVGACLADALHYAHERGLLHLDLKPANVLLGADGQPLLLDFHLARGPLPAHEAAPDWLGGTPGYMSPEQRAALAAMRRGQPIPTAVDARSDVYSLGLLLCEALGEEVPLPHGISVPPLSRRNPQVSVGLADLLRKCLAHDPRDRYASAAALAEDLRRHLNDLPLGGVANRSLTERWRKWRRRRPHALGLTGMTLAILLTVLAAAAVARTHVGQRFRQAEEARAAGEQHLKNRDYAAAIPPLTQGLALAKGTPGGGELSRTLDGKLRLARRARAAQDLNQAADRLRWLFDAESLPRGELPALEASCRALWEARGRILDRCQAELEPEVEQRIQTDLLDLAILWADLHVRLMPGYRADPARREALQVLAEAETLFGPSPALCRERQAHADALGLPVVAATAAHTAAQLTPRTSWDHYALGRFLLRSGNLELAAASLEQAIAQQPQSFWTHFYYGLSSYRLGRYPEAVTAFTACITLAPASAPCYYNRALVYAALGRTERALEDYGRALHHDPTLAVAALNRGLLHYRGQRLGEAVADLERARDCGADPATVYYNLALVHLARQDRVAALACAQRTLRHHPGHPGACELLERLQHQR